MISAGIKGEEINFADCMKSMMVGGFTGVLTCLNRAEKQSCPFGKIAFKLLLNQYFYRSKKMKKGDISELTKELQDIKNLKIETENIDYIPIEQEISKKSKAKNLQCSVMFVDMRNSTKMQDANGRKNMLKIYKMFAKLVTRAVEENYGKVMQIVGDGLLCLFVNEEKNSGQHAIDAVRSINTYVAESYNPIVEPDWKIKCGMGVCSGHILLTRIGTRGKNKCCQLAFPSYVTNYASKCCDNAEAKEVIFDKETYNQISPFDKVASEETAISGYGTFYKLQDIKWKI